MILDYIENFDKLTPTYVESIRVLRDAPKSFQSMVAKLGKLPSPRKPGRLNADLRLIGSTNKKNDVIALKMSEKDFIH